MSFDIDCIIWLKFKKNKIKYFQLGISYFITVSIHNSKFIRYVVVSCLMVFYCTELLKYLCLKLFFKEIYLTVQIDNILLYINAFLMS